MEHVLTLDPGPRRVASFEPSDAIVEVARLQRELMAAIQAKHAREQCGEAFEGLDTDRRNS